jgi:anti-anti-sigma factor
MPASSRVEQEFSIATAVRQGCRILTPRGDLDDLAAPELDLAIGEHPDAPAVVDLSSLAFITSAGIHVLVRDRDGGHPAVVCPPGHIARVLRIVDATRTMRLFEDVGTAVEAVSTGRSCERVEVRTRMRPPGMRLGRSHEKRSIGRS